MESRSLPLRRRFFLLLALAGLATLVVTMTASANVALTQIFVDPFTNSTSQHKTAAEPDTFSFGSTIVAAVQSGRFFDGGSSGIGWSTSTNNGVSWTSGTLPGITKFTTPAGPYDRATDPSVAYDARHNVWMVSTLALTDTSGVSGKAVLTSRSTDGGLTWTLSKTPRVGVIGGQPLVQPNGNVVVPLDNASETALGYTISSNGGSSFGNAFTITSISSATDPGGIRSGPLPSAEIDGSGKIFVAWADCRFRTNCTQNDIVYTTSTNGTSWTAVQRVPIDSVTSGVDHLLPGLGVDKATSGASAHLGLLYYFFPAGTTNLSVGYISSTNGGSTWSAPTQLAGPMTMSWLPNTSQGRMVGDYMSTSFAGGTAHPVFTLANAPTAGGSDCQTATPNCDQALYTPSSGLAAAAGTATASDPVVFTSKISSGKSAFNAHQR